MSREILEGEVASLRSFMERALYAAISTGGLQKQRISLEKYVDRLKLIPLGDRTNTEWDILRSVILLKAIECGSFQPSVYNPPKEEEDDCDWFDEESD